MKERPILFSAPMVRALLDGSKTQTRRAVKGVPLDWIETQGFTPEFVADSGNGLCPYGQPDDRLWVREAFRRDLDRFPLRKLIVYRADDAEKDAGDKGAFDFPDVGWKPSIHMPRWASRITLEITGVRVERLQDISEADAAAEGVSAKHTADAHYTAREAYAVLWEQINGPDSWTANPWVWVIEFKRVQP